MLLLAILATEQDKYITIGGVGVSPVDMQIPYNGCFSPGGNIFYVTTNSSSEDGTTRNKVLVDDEKEAWLFSVLWALIPKQARKKILADKWDPKQIISMGKHEDFEAIISLLVHCAQSFRNLTSELESATSDPLILDHLTSSLEYNLEYQKKLRQAIKDIIRQKGCTLKQLNPLLKHIKRHLMSGDFMEFSDKAGPEGPAFTFYRVNFNGSGYLETPDGSQPPRLWKSDVLDAMEYTLSKLLKETSAGSQIQPMATTFSMYKTPSFGPVTLKVADNLLNNLRCNRHPEYVVRMFAKYMDMVPMPVLSTIRNALGKLVIVPDPVPVEEPSDK